MIENPIFIVGTERSGSNLLRVLIHQLHTITTPHPPHLMRDMAPLIKNYGDLQKPKNFNRLIHHAVKLVSWHFAPWPFSVTEAKVKSEIGQRAPSLYAIYAAIYELYRRYEDKKRWCCKSTFMVNHVQEVLNFHKEPQFIHLVRDPRDVAVSARKSIFSFYHPYFVAKLWQKEQEIALGWSRRLDSKTWLTLKYEDLLENPERECLRLCEFLGEPFKPDMLEYFKSKTAKNLAALSDSWKNVAQPILKQNSGRYLSQLSKDETSLIEAVAGDTMLEYGYKKQGLVTEAPPDWLMQKKFAVIENRMKFETEGKTILSDKNFWRRHRKKIYLRALKIKALSTYL